MESHIKYLNEIELNCAGYKKRYDLIKTLYEETDKMIICKE